MEKKEVKKNLSPDSDRLHLTDDLVAENVVGDISKSPIGKLLKDIASLPQIRQEALDKVLEELLF